MPQVNYQAIIKELKERFSTADQQDFGIQLVADKMCRRMKPFLEADPPMTLAEMIAQLEEKWRSDGLIGTSED